MMTTVLRSRLRSLALAGTCFGVAASPFLTAKAQQTSTPQPVILADFNHDGIPDVLVVSTTSPTATIAFGSVPYGTFATTSKAVTFPAACTSLPQGSVLTGDFNNDGLADIAFFCGATEGVMLGNGDGTFGAPKLLNAGSSQLAVLGDFNKDGKLDIAIIGAPGGNVTTQNIEFLAGNGDGTFAVAKVSPLPQAGYTAPIAADIDGDGYLDIVLGSFNTDGDTAPSVNVFGYNQGGTFGVSGQGVFNPSVSANVSISAASSVLAGNFFGTDANDLIVPDTGTTPGLFLIQNNSTSGNFSLGTPAKTAVAGLKAAMPGFFQRKRRNGPHHRERYKHQRDGQWRLRRFRNGLYHPHHRLYFDALCSGRRERRWLFRHLHRCQHQWGTATRRQHHHRIGDRHRPARHLRHRHGSALGRMER